MSEDDRTPEEVTSTFVTSVAQALVELSFFEGYFEAQDEHSGEGVHADLRDRCQRARVNLQAAWMDVIQSGGG